MLKDRGQKGSWKSAASKKKSYGNIYSINDRGIHEIIETLGGAANGGGAAAPAGSAGANSSAPSSPWSSPLMGRKSLAQVQQPVASVDRSKILPLTAQ